VPFQLRQEAGEHDLIAEALFAEDDNTTALKALAAPFRVGKRALMIGETQDASPSLIQKPPDAVFAPRQECVGEIVARQIPAWRCARRSQKVRDR
jgi:hypothetical protein